jgi:hypothetical protein
MPDMTPAAWPGSVFFDSGSPFAEMERISAAMDRRMNQMLRNAEAMMALPDMNGVNDISLQNAPPGTSSYSVVSTISGSHVCTRSVRITSPADGGKPQMVSQSSGDCAGVAPGGSETGVTGNGMEIRDTPPRRAPVLQEASLQVP